MTYDRTRKMLELVLKNDDMPPSDALLEQRDIELCEE